mmetsp:Transcript_109143/g.163235  ORF Transcript_109143/g.163235 Transcript_109143/m.163235 type:complete len:435 (-) Transcript_109143:34-1338(-)
MVHNYDSSIQAEETTLLKVPVSESTVSQNMEESTRPTGDELSNKANPNNIVYRQIFFVVMPIFCGYATLFSMQEQVMEAMYGDQADEPTIFGIACSMLYIGNLVFRLGHNIVFSFAIPRTRVVIAMTSMALSMWSVFCIFVWFRDPAYIWLVFIGYGLGGVAIGTFESNILSVVTPLGKDTKLWAIVAIPVGINVVNIGGFLLLGLWPWLGENPELIQFCVLIFILFGIVLFYVSLYDKCDSVTSFSIKEFVFAFKYWKEWIWLIKYNCIAMVFDMFFVSLFSPGIILYIYNGACVQFTLTGFTMNSFWFIALYNSFFFLGDTLSRKIFYKLRLINPFLFLLFSVGGIVMGLLDITILVPLTALGVSFANGSLYTQTNRFIDKEIPERFNLVSISFWLFIGDIGSVVGSNMISFMSTWVKEIYNSTDPISSSLC